MENLVLWNNTIKTQLEKIRAMSPDDENYSRLMDLCRKNAELIQEDEKTRADFELQYAKLQQEKKLADKNRRAETARTVISVGVPVVAGGVATGFLAYMEMTGKMLTGTVVKEGVKKVFMKMFGR